MSPSAKKKKRSLTGCYRWPVQRNRKIRANDCYNPKEKEKRSWQRSYNNFHWRGTTRCQIRFPNSLSPKLREKEGQDERENRRGNRLSPMVRPGRGFPLLPSCLLHDRSVTSQEKCFGILPAHRPSQETDYILVPVRQSFFELNLGSNFFSFMRRQPTID